MMEEGRQKRVGALGVVVEDEGQEAGLNAGPSQEGLGSSSQSMYEKSLGEAKLTPRRAIQV